VWLRSSGAALSLSIAEPISLILGLGTLFSFQHSFPHGHPSGRNLLSKAVNSPIILVSFFAARGFF